MKIVPTHKFDSPSEEMAVFSPAVRVDESMRVLYANPAAQKAGISTGDTLTLKEGSGERLRHEACFARSPLTRYDPLGSPQNAAQYTLTNTHGFRLAYVEYTYTFHRCQAIAVLFRTKQEYLHFTATLQQGPRRYCGMLLQSLRTLRDTCRNTSADGMPVSADTVEELMTVTLLTLQCFYPDAVYTGGKRIYSLRRTVDAYISALTDYAAALSVSLALPFEAGGGDMYTQLDPECLYLLLSALLSVVSDISDDHTARIWLSEEGEDRSIHIRTRCGRLSRILRRTSDVQALAVAAPRKKMQLTMAEFLAGYCRYDILIDGDEEAETLTLTVFLPSHPTQPDFKTPLYADAHLDTTMRAICRLFTLMDADQQKKHHDHIHAPLVLGTEQKQ